MNLTQLQRLPKDRVRALPKTASAPSSAWNPPPSANYWPPSCPR